MGMISRSRWRLGPIAASIFAGFTTAAVVDTLVTLARGNGAVAPGSILLLAIALYGALGLAAALTTGWLAGAVLRASASGPVGLVADEGRDARVATAVVAAAAGVVVMAGVVAMGHKVLVRPMQSDKLATIAVAGLVLLSAPLAAAVAVALLRPLWRWVIPGLPRPRSIGRTGVLLLAATVVGVMAAGAAFSRADWRVLDLQPFVALAIGAAGGLAHGLFWYRSRTGTQLARGMPGVALSVLAVAVVVLSWVLASRISAASPAFRAIDEGSLGLRLALRVARAATDRDGDGFSGRFGGGDCDDGRADVYPGAEDIPGNQIDENCEGGDATPVAEEAAPAAAPAPPAPAAPAAPAAHGDHGSTRAVATASPAAAPGTAGAGAGTYKGNVLIITIDALRADRLGIAGYRRAGRSLTPHLDALASRGAYFKRVWSQAPNTPRSFPAILTSQYPSAVKWDKPTVNYPLVLPANHTFFEDLSAAGLTPIGVFSHFYFTADRGISKAFKEWSNDGAGTIAESNKDSASPRIVPRVLARLKKAAATRERFVLWTHLFEPHSSYMPHREFPSSGTGGVPGLLEKYDNEIAFVDMWVGKLLKGLDGLGLAGNTAVVVMADHGEAWGEHRSFFHGQDLFDEQLRIPLIIAIPGRAPLVSADPVAAVDVGPTLVELVGGALPKSFRGRSLLPVIAGAEALPPRPLYAELMPATAWPHHAAMMVDADKKIIHRISERRWELYDLARDPGEKRDLADDAAQRPLFERMRAMLLAFEERKR